MEYHIAGNYRNRKHSWISHFYTIRGYYLAKLLITVLTIIFVINCMRSDGIEKYLRLLVLTQHSTLFCNSRPLLTPKSIWYLSGSDLARWFQLKRPLMFLHALSLKTTFPYYWHFLRGLTNVFYSRNVPLYGTQK